MSDEEGKRKGGGDEAGKEKGAGWERPEKGNGRPCGAVCRAREVFESAALSRAWPWWRRADRPRVVATAGARWGSLEGEGARSAPLRIEMDIVTEHYSSNNSQQFMLFEISQVQCAS